MNSDELKLIKATEDGDIDTCILLLEIINVNFYDKTLDTPLHIAVFNGDLNLIKLFLQKGADPNVKDLGGNTPLYEAILMEDFEIVKTLIENGANLNTRDKYGNTPLFMAVKKTNINIIEFLLKKGADVNTRNNNKLTPVYNACSYIIIELLAKTGACFNIKNKFGMTPLDNAKNYMINYGLTNNIPMIMCVGTMERFTKREFIITLLMCIREYIKDSVFYKKYLPNDMFKEIISYL